MLPTYVMMMQRALENLKISKLNPMQEAALAASKKENDIVLLSPTGSGKTIAFLLPLLHSLESGKAGIQAMIIVPSRELAIQIEQVFKQMQTGFKVSCCYGGHSTRTEKNNLEQAPALLVGTPGRIAFHIRNKYINTATVAQLVLDEFDKALEFGFQEDMSFIIYHLKNIQRRFLTSATQMPEIPDFTGIRKPVEINYLSKTPVKAIGLKIKVVHSTSRDKTSTLFSLLCKLGKTSTLVFCNHRDAVDMISDLLLEKGLKHGVFHGKMEQIDRERALIKFRNGTFRILVSTDLASRGLDIPEIENVVHFQLPHSEEIFIHRNGRTARMNATGSAFLVLSSNEHVPLYIKDKPETETLPAKDILPETTAWTTLYIAAGKKDKINKMDIVGMLLQKGKLEKEELGLIEVLDFSSYVAVSSKKINSLLEKIKNEKIKNKKVKMEVSN